MKNKLTSLKRSSLQEIVKTFFKIINKQKKKKKITAITRLIKGGGGKKIK